MQESSALMSNLEGTALNFEGTAKRTKERDSPPTIFEILLNRFGSAVQVIRRW